MSWPLLIIWSSPQGRKKNIHIDGILHLISRCSQVPEALGSGLRTFNQINRTCDYKSENLDSYLTLMLLMKCVTLDKLCIFCALKSSSINMIANVGNNLFLSIENFWHSGGIFPYKSKKISLLKVMCGPDIVTTSYVYIYLFSSLHIRGISLKLILFLGIFSLTEAFWQLSNLEKNTLILILNWYTGD